MLQQFWKSWPNEHLTQHQSRCKWNKPSKNIERGDIVLVRETNLPPGKWALGRIQEVHPGSDGLVRVTTVKTQTSVIKRPITTLSPLPLVYKKPEKENEQEIKTKREKRNNSGMKTFSTLFIMLVAMFTLIT
ncbi:unnamed protein product [Parnassius apollo]|uniref:(apollo) hypothetical protein n=1 Tax=Parnassius apollo TaxID=110799 RepID=A0A8S3XHJ7_PARAO|nr:unnamed protein product [Parnassius apollo]